MRNSILASIDHVTSTDDNPKHSLCPKGPDDKNFCLYNRAIARGRIPPPHSEIHKTVKMGSLAPDHVARIRAVYEDLSRDELLEKCLKCRTQNPNESIHSIMWTKAQKTKFYGKKTIENLAKSLSVEHNLSYTDANIMQKFDFYGSTSSRTYLDNCRDRHRTIKSGTIKRKAGNPRSRIAYVDADYGSGNF